MKIAACNRIVVDSNMLQSELLSSYLAEASTNFAVLPDFVWVEAYKQRSLPGIVAALSIIGRFPEQIVVLKSSHDIADLDPTLRTITDAMIRTGVAHDLRGMAEALEQGYRGEPGVLAQLDLQWSAVARDMDGMLEGASDILQSLPEMAKMFSADEIRRCRTSADYTKAMFEKIFGAADQICETLFEMRGRAPPALIWRSTAYLYRYALAIMIYLLWWIRNGSQIPKRHDRARNDFIDLSFAIYGSYFDGFMTADAKAGWMYAELRSALEFERSLPR